MIVQCLQLFTGLLPHERSTTRHSGRIAALVFLGFILACPVPTPAQTVDIRSDGSRQQSNTAWQDGPALHVFDFEERDEGNLEDVPKYWGQIELPGFPHFAKGRFDFKAGHNAPPAFYLASEGRSVGFRYTGPDTVIRVGTEYRVEAALKPKNLRRSRACLCAFYQDPLGHPIIETLVRSRYLMSTDTPGGWQNVDLFLPPAPRRAQSISLAVWVLAEPIWNDARKPRRHIPLRDVRGGLWVDDIAVYPLPRVELRCLSAGCVVPQGDKSGLSVLLWDTEQKGITGQLNIMDSQGDVVLTKAIDTSFLAAVKPTLVAIDPLIPGVYRADLTAYVAGKPVVTRHIQFVRLAPRYRPVSASAGAFGIVLDPRYRLDADSEVALLGNLAVRSVKWPAWTGLGSEKQDARRHQQDDKLLQELARRGFAVTAVLGGPPTAIVDSSGPYARTLLDVLADQPSYWKAYLDAVAAPYASIIRWWQLGEDSQPWEYLGKQFDKGTTQLALELRRFIIAPEITAPLSAVVDFPTRHATLEQATLAISTLTDPTTLEAELARYRESGYRRLTAYVEPLPRDAYRREDRLADFATRMIEARHAGAQTVFVPQPWTVRVTPAGQSADPFEDYMIVRTLADVLADATPGPVITMNGTIRALVFYQDNHAKVAIWDPEAPSEGRPVAIQLGSAQRYVTAFGESISLDRDSHGQQLVPISPMPILIDHVDRALIDFRTGVRIAPTHVESGSEIAVHTLTVPNPAETMLAGSLTLSLPDGWLATPRSFDFSVMPGRDARFKIRIKYPHNESAGPKKILARVSFSNGTYMEVPLSLELGLSDFIVTGMAIVEGTDLVIIHTVSNRSDKVAHFRSAAIVAGRQRHYRPIVNLQPHETQTAQYRFPDAADLIGSRIRLELREMNDGPRTHSLELVVP